MTLVLCVYNAIHLNIPYKDDSQATVFLRKAKWVLIAIFAPELAVYVAWSQRQKVKDIHTYSRFKETPRSGRLMVY